MLDVTWKKNIFPFYPHSAAFFVVKIYEGNRNVFFRGCTEYMQYLSSGITRVTWFGKIAYNYFRWDDSLQTHAFNDNGEECEAIWEYYKENSVGFGL